MNIGKEINNTLDKVKRELKCRREYHEKEGIILNTIESLIFFTEYEENDARDIITLERDLIKVKTALQLFDILD